MSADRWEELERLAKAATPGPWAAQDRRNGMTHIRSLDDLAIAYLKTTYGRRCPSSGDNAAFIAAANPATVLELIAAARQQAPENKEPGT